MGHQLITHAGKILGAVPLELLWAELPSARPAAMAGAAGKWDWVPARRKELWGLAPTGTFLYVPKQGLEGLPRLPRSRV